LPYAVPFHLTILEGLFETSDTMSNKPIFVATHPRACSTAFERVFMTRRDGLTCVHEPFGDAFYFGPERLSERYENDEKARKESGFGNSTFKTIFERLERESKEGKRLFIKDITHYLVPPEGKLATIAPSLGGKAIKKGVGTDQEVNDVSNSVRKAPYPYNTAAEPGNPTVVPTDILKQFHFTFLIRHPRSSIPSYYRCTVPPLDAVTGFYNFMPSEAGYDELRRVFDYLREQKQIGPALAGQHGALKDGEVSTTVVDADDLLDDPEGIIKVYCKEVGIEYDPGMLNWDTEVDHKQAKDAFEKWNGFHIDAIESTSLKPRDAARKIKTIESENIEWLEKYGEKGQKIIRECVNQNIPDYEYLKSFAIKV